MGPPRYYWGKPMKQVRNHLSALFVLTCLFSVGIFLVVASTVEENLTHTPTLMLREAPVPTITASAVHVVDLETGTVLYEQNAETVLPIASVTKLFSAAAFWAGTDPLGTATISAEDVAEEGRSGRLKGGQTYQNRELLFPALLESSNDAAAAMERNAPFDLIAAMNTFAAEAGASNTQFADASGISDDNVSTAKDLTTLFTALLTREPHIIDITTLPTYLNHVNAWQNNSPFIDMEGYRGGKHGYTYAANRTAVARFTEQTEAGEREVLYVLLGSEDLKADMTALRGYTVASIYLQ